MTDSEESVTDPTAASDLPVRNVNRHRSLGFQYRDELFNIALLRIDPGYELDTILTVDQRLLAYRGRLRRAEKALRNQEMIDPEDYPGGDRLTCEPEGLLANAVHATLAGNFQLASFFTSVGFGLCNDFAPLTHVSSQQYIVAGVPVPSVCIQPEWVNLKQNPTDFLSPYDYRRMMNDAGLLTDAEESVLTQPIISITHIQLTGPISTISAGSLILPILHMIEAKAAAVGGDLRLLLLDSFGWSDFVLLVRGGDIQKMGQLVYDIAQTTQQELLDYWGKLIQCIDNADAKDAQEDQLKAYHRRFGRMAQILSPDFTGLDPNSQQADHLFSMTFTLPGVLWPFADDALKYECGGADTASYPVIAKRFTDDWKIAGKVRIHLRMNIKPGHEPEVWLQGGEETTSENPFFSLGHEDVILPHSSRALLPGTKEDEAVPLKDILGKILKLQWHLLGSPLSLFEDVCDQPLMWKNHRNTPISERPLTPLLATTMDLEVLLNVPRAMRTSTFSIADQYEKEISSKFEEAGTEASIWKLRKRLVSRHALNSLVQVIALWREKLRDYSDANRMIELADSWITWFTALKSQLDSGYATPGDIEELVRFFTLPFGKAVVQRFITGFHMSEATDFTAEFKGGLSKVLTGLDGLMKSILALVTAPNHTGALTLTGHDSRATIEIRRVVDEHTAAEFTLAVANLNSAHLVHPLNVHTVIHEILHTIPNSRDFRAVLSRYPEGQGILRFLDLPESDSKDGLIRIRLEEIIVEYLLATLVFQGKGELYSHSYLLQIAIHPESYSGTDEMTRLFMMENIARGFVIQRMLEKHESTDVPLDWLNVESDFATWWDRNQRYVMLDSALARKCGKAMGAMLSGQPPEWAARVEAVRKAVSAYFSTDGADVDAASARVRREFYGALKNVETFDRQTKESLASGSPVHVVFPPDLAGSPERGLRVRRLESLVAYLRLITGFYEALDDLLNLVPGSPLLLKRHEGKLDFRNGAPGQTVLINASAGALFTAGDERHRQYCKLRIAFLKSMWQHAEVTKNSEINHLIANEQSLSPTL